MMFTVIASVTIVVVIVNSHWRSCHCRLWHQHQCHCHLFPLSLVLAVVTVVVVVIVIVTYSSCQLLFIGWHYSCTDVSLAVNSTGGSDSSLSDGLPMHLIYAPETLQLHQVRVKREMYLVEFV